jgi:rubrerythrin
MRKLYDQTMEELDGVMEYSKCAMRYKEMDPELSKMYVTMAKAEMEHAKTLHAASHPGSHGAS